MHWRSIVFRQQFEPWSTLSKMAMIFPRIQVFVCGALRKALREGDQRPLWRTGLDVADFDGDHFC
jgi:hypothetical protein